MSNVQIDLKPVNPLRRPPRPVERLKAERVQEALRAMPGWNLTHTGRAIHRVHWFPSRDVAVAYASYVSALAYSESQRVHLSVMECRVAVTVYGASPVVEGDGWIDQGNLDFAVSLG